MTAQQLQRRMLRRAALVESEFRKTTNGLGIAAVKYCKEKLTAELYSIPEDVSPRTGKKKWTRTGHLRRSERAELRGPYSVAIVNDAKVYAASRHEAGKKTSTIVKKPRNINPIRETHWRDDLKVAFRPIERDAYRATVLHLLRQGRI